MKRILIFLWDVVTGVVFREGLHIHESWDYSKIARDWRKQWK